MVAKTLAHLVISIGLTAIKTTAYTISRVYDQLHHTSSPWTAMSYTRSNAYDADLLLLLMEG